MCYFFDSLARLLNMRDKPSHKNGLILWILLIVAIFIGGILGSFTGGFSAFWAWLTLALLDSVLKWSLIKLVCFSILYMVVLGFIGFACGGTAVLVISFALAVIPAYLYDKKGNR